jgi:SP family sugar:H+ symporter-like MFS transporter
MISGMLEMEDFLKRFHDLGVQPDKNLPDPYAFTNVRAGTIVALLSIGTLLGALLSAPVADTFGRKICIIFWNIVFIVGMIVQIATETAWYQIAIGRLVAGLGVGGLSVLTPMYMSETAPRQIRGSMVASYQLAITFGILIRLAFKRIDSEACHGSLLIEISATSSTLAPRPSYLLRHGGSQSALVSSGRC